MKINAKKVR